MEAPRAAAQTYTINVFHDLRMLQHTFLVFWFLVFCFFPLHQPPQLGWLVYCPCSMLEQTSTHSKNRRLKMFAMHTVRHMQAFKWINIHYLPCRFSRPCQITLIKATTQRCVGTHFSTASVDSSSTADRQNVVGSFAALCSYSISPLGCTWRFNANALTS